MLVLNQCFLPFQNKFQISSHIDFIVCKCFQYDKSEILLFGKEFPWFRIRRENFRQVKIQKECRLEIKGLNNESCLPYIIEKHNGKR